MGAPGASVDALISVGAYVNGNMCDNLYGMRAPAANAGGPESATHGGVMYSFSSRGPRRTAAAASISRRRAAPSRLYLDTRSSRSGSCTARRWRRRTPPAPAACLLSAAKAAGKNPAPDAVKRVLEATAKPLPGVAQCNQGQGLVDVDAALTSLGEIDELDVRFEVRVPSRAAGAGAPGARGIYLRERWETTAPREVAVTVTPKFQGDDDVAAERKGLFRRDVRLEATAPWLSVGKGVVVTQRRQGVHHSDRPVRGGSRGRGARLWGGAGLRRRRARRAAALPRARGGRAAQGRRGRLLLR